MPPLELVNMFAVPFAFSRYPDHARLNPALKQYLFELERTGNAANPHPLTQRNATIFESHFNLFRDNHPAIQELKAFCWDQLLAVVGRMNGYDLPTLHRLLIYNDCWFHITRRGGFFGVHNHPNASWSGVYCVDPGRHDPGKKESGQLSFINPPARERHAHRCGCLQHVAAVFPSGGRHVPRARTARDISIVGAARRQAL